MSDNKKLYVLKSNKIIEAQYKLSAREQKFILYMASKIRADDTEFEFYEVKVSDIAEVLNASGKKQGNIHQEIYEMCQNFNKKPIRIEGPDGRVQLINWVASADFQPTRGLISFEFSKRLKPLLLNLKAHFTKYSLEYVMQLSSSYSIRFYELLKRHQFKTPSKFTITLEELKTILDIQDSYKEYRYFKKRVLNVAQEELDEKADIGFTYEEHRVKRRVVSLTLKIYENKPSDAQEIKQEDDQARLFEERAERQHPLVVKMVMIGFKTTEAQALFDQGFGIIKEEETREEAIARYITSEGYFQAKIDMFHKEHAAKPKKSPKGFLVKALELNYQNEKEETAEATREKVQNRKSIQLQIKQVKVALQELVNKREREEGLILDRIFQQNPLLLESIGNEIGVKKNFLYDASQSLEQNYQRPTIQAIINAAIKERFQAAFDVVGATYTQELEKLEIEMKGLEASLKESKANEERL